MIESLVIVDQNQDQEKVQIGTGLHVSSAESTTISWDCPTTQANGEVEQIQQMFNMDKEQTILQISLMDIDQVRQSISPVEARENLNL